MSHQLLQVIDCEQTREIRYVDNTLIPSSHISNFLKVISPSGKEYTLQCSEDLLEELFPSPVET